MHQQHTQKSLELLFGTGLKYTALSKAQYNMLPQARQGRKTSKR